MAEIVGRIVQMDGGRSVFVGRSTDVEGDPSLYLQFDNPEFRTRLKLSPDTAENLRQMLYTGGQHGLGDPKTYRIREVEPDPESVWSQEEDALQALPEGGN